MANFIRGFTSIRSPSSQTRTRPETRVWWLSKPETRVWQKGSGFGIPTPHSGDATECLINILFYDTAQTAGSRTTTGTFPILW